MEQEELIETLNEKQKAYVNFNIENLRNGEYMLAIFHLKPGNNLNILQAAAEISSESSTGTNFKVKTETAFSREMNDGLCINCLALMLRSKSTRALRS